MEVEFSPASASNTASRPARPDGCRMNIAWVPLLGWMGAMMYMKSQASKSSTGPTTPDFDPVLDMIRGTPLETLWKWMFGGYLGLSIYASIVLAQTTQSAFSVSDRNALGAATAFISPIESVFQFLEDTVTVQINYSLAAGTTSKTKEIFWTSIRSAIICGVAASLMCTVIGKAHDSLATVVAPGAENDKNMYPGCALIEDALTVARSARPFFLLYIWRFPFKFVNLVISGLLFGAKQIQLMGCIWLLGEVALLLTWYWLPTADERHDNTMLLGLSSLLQVVVVSVVAMSALFFLKPLQVYTGVNFLLADPKPTTLREQLAEKDAEPARQPLIRGLSKLQKELMLDGAKVLMMDLCLQLATTITFYVALLHSAPTAYQLTALNNAMPQYGLAYVLGIRFISKIVGAQLLSRRRYAAFRVFAAMALVATLLICCVSIGVVLSYRDSIAFEYGYNACEFAGSAECYPVFEGVFGGSNSLQSNFRVFAGMLFVDSIFNVLRGLVLSCLDFDFIGKAAGAAFVCVYVPAILIAWGTGVTARGLYIAQNTPMIFLMLGHIWRLHSNVAKMSAGVNGPWSKGVAPVSDTAGTPGAPQQGTTQSVNARYEDERAELLTEQLLRREDRADLDV